MKIFPQQKENKTNVKDQKIFDSMLFGISDKFKINK